MINVSRSMDAYCYCIVPLIQVYDLSISAAAVLIFAIYAKELSRQKTSTFGDTQRYL